MSERSPQLDDQILRFIEFRSAELNGLTITLDGDSLDSLETGVNQVKRHLTACLDLSEQILRPGDATSFAKTGWTWDRLTAPAIDRNRLRAVIPGFAFLPNFWVDYFAASMGLSATDDSNEGSSLSSRGLFVDFEEAHRVNSIELGLIVSATAAIMLILITATFCLLMIRRESLRAQTVFRTIDTLNRHLDTTATSSERGKILDGMLATLSSVKDSKRLLNVKFRVPGSELSVSLEDGEQDRKPKS